ncbi:MAG: hypothetical protein RR313_03610 [Anaerovoracaceae bacterium]
MVKKIGMQGTQKNSPNGIDVNSSATTVYVRENVKRIVDKDRGDYWLYDETSMTREEYLSMQANKNQSLYDNANAELLMIIMENQKQNDNALAELSMLIGGATNV